MQQTYGVIVQYSMVWYRISFLCADAKYSLTLKSMLISSCLACFQKTSWSYSRLIWNYWISYMSGSNGIASSSLSHFLLAFKLKDKPQRFTQGWNHSKTNIRRKRALRVDMVILCPTSVIKTKSVNINQVLIYDIVSLVPCSYWSLETLANQEVTLFLLISLRFPLIGHWCFNWTAHRFKDGALGHALNHTKLRNEES